MLNHGQKLCAVVAAVAVVLLESAICIVSDLWREQHSAYWPEAKCTIRAVRVEENCHELCFFRVVADVQLQRPGEKPLVVTAHRSASVGFSDTSVKAQTFSESLPQPGNDAPCWYDAESLRSNAYAGSLGSGSGVVLVKLEQPTKPQAAVQRRATYATMYFVLLCGVALAACAVSYGADDSARSGGGMGAMHCEYEELYETRGGRAKHLTDLAAL